MGIFYFSFHVLVLRSALHHCIQVETKTVMLQLLITCTAGAFDDLSQVWMFRGRLKFRADIYALPHQVFSGLRPLFLSNYGLGFALPINESIEAVLLQPWLNTENQLRCSGPAAPVLLSHHRQCCVNDTAWVKSHGTRFELKRLLYRRQQDLQESVTQGKI